MGDVGVGSTHGRGTKSTWVCVKCDEKLEAVRGEPGEDAEYG